jgi:hypothetical protein
MRRALGLGNSSPARATSHSAPPSNTLDRPVVAVGWNSERFDGRNLALRLAALGYTRLYWYRGSREAWEFAEQPEKELVLQEW